MTEIDTDEIREMVGDYTAIPPAPSVGPGWTDIIRNLCDALDEARAERERAEERWAEWFHRGTKAEAAIKRVTTVLRGYGDVGPVGSLATRIREALDGDQ